MKKKIIPIVILGHCWSVGLLDGHTQKMRKNEISNWIRRKISSFFVYFYVSLSLSISRATLTHVSCLKRLYALVRRVVFCIFCIVSFWTMKFDISNLNNHPKENEYIYFAFDIQHSKSWYFVWFVFSIFFFFLNPFKEINSLAVTLKRQVLSWMVFLFRHSFLRNPKNEKNKLK